MQAPQAARRTPYATYALIAINVVAFIAELGAGGGATSEATRPGRGHLRARRSTTAIGIGSSPAVSSTPGRCTCSSTCTSSTSPGRFWSRGSGHPASSPSTSSRCSAGVLRSPAARPELAHGRRLGRDLRPDGGGAGGRPRSRHRRARHPVRALHRPQPGADVLDPEHLDRRPPRRADRGGRRGADCARGRAPGLGACRDRVRGRRAADAGCRRGCGAMVAANSA